MTMTLGGLLAESRDAFRHAGIESAALDAELICCHAQQCDRAQLWAHPETAVGPDVVELCRELVERRAGREPLAYILGVKEFWSLEFRVTPAVFIPRPETETLAWAVLELVAEDASGTIVEVGTGSGCLAVAVASERAGLSVVTTDISRAALAVARENIHIHGLEERVLCVECDAVQAIGEARPILGVMSNPPYVPQPVFDNVAEEVRYEPTEALDGGSKGLELIGRIIEQAAVLRPGAFLALEVGPEQVADVGVILADGPWNQIEAVEDLQGMPRVVVAFRAEEG